MTNLERLNVMTLRDYSNLLDADRLRLEQILRSYSWGLLNDEEMAKVSWIRAKIARASRLDRGN